MFLDFLWEIQERVVSYCSVADLLNLASTCSSYREALRPFLYKTVRLPLLDPTHFNQHKNILNVIEKYTRVIKLSPKDYPKDDGISEGNIPDHFLALFNVPEHILSYVGKLSNLWGLELSLTRVIDEDLALVLPNLKRLKMLNLADTAVRNLSESIQELRELEQLILHPCNHGLTDMALLRVSCLCTLKRLEIDGRRLSDNGFADIWRLSRLETLVIQGCDEITDVSLFHIAMLQNLRWFHARGTGINDKGVKHLTALKKLTTLALWSCSNITDQGFEQICSLTSLQNLETGFCRGFGDEGFAHVVGLKGLVDLSINGCFRLSDRACAHIAMLPSLKRVDISGCRYITDMGIQTLSSLPNLEELTMSGCNHITSLGFAYICKITTLCKLDIEQCWINEMSLLRIMNYLPRLKWINISYCHGVSDKSVENYRKHKPNIDIVVIS